MDTAGAPRPRSTRLPRAGAASAALAALMVLAACGASPDEVLDAGPAPGRGDPAASPTAPAAERDVTVYVPIDGGGRMALAAERRSVPDVPRIATAALDELLHGQPADGRATPFPERTQVLSVTIADGTATVDWNAAVLEASAGGELEGATIQAVVWTLTEFPTIDRVRFTVEGRDRGQASNGRAIEDWWGHVGLTGQPWERDTTVPVVTG